MEATATLLDLIVSTNQRPANSPGRVRPSHLRRASQRFFPAHSTNFAFPTPPLTVSILDYEDDNLSVAIYIPPSQLSLPGPSRSMALPAVTGGDLTARLRAMVLRRVGYFTPSLCPSLMVSKRRRSHAGGRDWRTLGHPAGNTFIGSCVQGRPRWLLVTTTTEGCTQ